MFSDEINLIRKHLHFYISSRGHRGLVDPNKDGRGGHFKDYLKAIKSLIVRFENSC